MTTPSTLTVGTRFTTGSVILEGTDARTVVDLCGYTHPMFAGEGPPEMIPGQLVLALAAGLLESSGRIGDDVIALVGLDKVRFEGPLAPGQELTVDVEVTDRSTTSRTDRDLLELTLRANSQGRPVVTALATFLFASHDNDSPPD